MKKSSTDLGKDYHALRNTVGLIDHEGTGLFAVNGPAAAAFLGRVATRSVDFLLEGQVSAVLLLREDATVLAEALVHCRGTGYLVEVWPGQAEAARAHLAAAADGFGDVTFADVSADHRVLGLEGPESPKLVQKFLPFPVASMAYRSFVTVEHGDVALLISRTGVTGEYGYKVHVPAGEAATLRAELISLGARACGPAAVDVCRMETRFVNLEREGAEPLTPFQLGLQWMVDVNQEFVGRDALMAGWSDGFAELPVCWAGEEGVETVPASGAMVAVGKEKVGRVAHAVYSPTLGRVVGTALVDTQVAASGLTFKLGTAKIHTVSAPFLVATSFGTSLE